MLNQSFSISLSYSLRIRCSNLSFLFSEKCRKELLSKYKSGIERLLTILEVRVFRTTSPVLGSAWETRKHQLSESNEGVNYHMWSLEVGKSIFCLFWRWIALCIYLNMYCELLYCSGFSYTCDFHVWRWAVIFKNVSQWTAKVLRQQGVVFHQFYHLKPTSKQRWSCGVGH